MRIQVISEHGYEEALFGLGLSRSITSGMEFEGETPERMQKVAQKLAGRGKGHDKFLESIIVWLDITAPRYWWQQFDTYRIGMTKQSESTMYTLLKEPITQEHFEQPLPLDILTELNRLRDMQMFDDLKNCLPEGWLQRRIVCTNYKAIHNIISQRQNHKLKAWQAFCEDVLSQLQHPELLKKV